MPIGHISVIPQPWVTCRPCRSPNASIRARGGAAPPTVIVRSEDRSQRVGSASSACRIPTQIVGTPAVMCHPLALEGVEQRDRIEVLAGIDVLDAGEDRREREAPRVGVKHRDDRKADVVARQSERAGDRQRMDRDRAMRVDDALRLPCGAARVAHGRGSPFVGLRVRPVVRALGGEKLLEVDRAVGRRAFTDRDDVLEADSVLERLDERPEHLVGDQDSIASVSRDVGQVVGMKPQVQGVRDEPAHRGADVRLQVLVMVPRERADPVTVLEPELVAQRERELFRPADEVRVRVAMPAAVREPADDLPVAVQLLTSSQDRRHGELVVHRQAVHQSPPPSRWSAISARSRAPEASQA